MPVESTRARSRALWSSSVGFAIHAAHGHDGRFIYLGREFGPVPRIPLIFAISQQHAELDRLTAQEQGRPTSRRVMRALYSFFARNAVRRSQDALRIVVEAARGCWNRGHPLLRAIATVCRSRCGSVWDEHTTRAVFGDRYYARARQRPVTHDLRYFQIERRWRAEKRQALPQYFDAWGVPSAKRVMDGRLKALKLDRYCLESRAPTPAERDCLGVLSRATRRLCPEFAVILKRNRVRFAVGETQVMAGRFQEHLRPRGYEVFLAERVFRVDFAQALSIFLHEHAHVFGDDGTREFTDALTYLLESVVQQRVELDAFESAWLTVQASFIRERDTDDHGSTVSIRA